MKLFRALSVSALCFLTRHTCAAVPVFEDTMPSMRKGDRANGRKEPYNFSSSQYNTKQWKENQERKMANYILQEIKNCRSLLPSENGFLVHIDYSTSSYMQSPIKETSSNSVMQKRALRKLVKTWKSMPTDQRLQAVGSLAGVIALPAFLTGAAQAWDAEQIQKIKQKAAEAEVAKHKGVKVKKVKDQSTTAMPPPPPSAFNHVKRNEIVIQYDRKEQRGLPGTLSKSLGHVHLPSGRSSMNRAASRGVTHAGSHMSTGMSKSVSSATKQANTVKEPNPTVARVLSWTGAMTSLMYIPAAYQAIHKAQYVTDDDAHAYKRRAINNDEGMEFDLELPTVTCIPIARKGLNYVIPEGALQSQNVLSSSFSSTMPFYQDTSLNRRAESAALNKAGKHAKLVGIAGMGVGLGWLMHQLNQRRDESEIDENTLLRRDDSEMESSEELERRWKPGKGSVLTSAIFAGTALSASGFGVPQLHATITEDPKAGNVKSRLQKREQIVLQRRQNFRHQLGRAATDKVTMFLATTATAYGAVKTGAASALYNAIVKPPPKSNPQQHVRRDQDSKDSVVDNDDDDQTILLDYESCTKDDCQLERRSGRKTTIFAAALLGTFLGQRTGKSGQEKENKQYLEQIGQGSPKRRRMVQNEFVMQENALVKRSPGKNSEVVESASTTVQPYILPGTVAVTTLAASFAGRKAVKSAAKKELDRRDVESTFVKRAGKDKLGKTASQLARQMSKGKGPAVSHAVTETVHVTHVNLGQHGSTPHVNAPHGSHSGGNHHSPQRSTSHSSKAGSSSSGSVQSKPHLQRQSSTASSSSSSPSTPHDGSRHAHHSKHQHEPNEQVKQFYRENSNVPMPSRVEEVHRIHHPPSAEHNGAHAGEEATKKKSSTGKKLIFATGGAALGALGHHQYTNFVDAKAQAAQEQPADPAAAAAAPVKRSLLQKRSPGRSRGRRRGSGGGGGGHSGGHGGTTTTFKMVHQHVFDHHLEPVGQQIKKGGGKKGLIGALLLGAVGGVVGHAIYHNSKANQAANQAPPVNAEEATAPQPAEPPKEEKPAPPAPKKRNLDDQNNTILEKRDKKGGGKLASALTGGLIGVAVAGYGYAFTHDQPGTRKKHTVPVGTLPQNTEGATKAKKRSVNEIVWQKEEATSFPLIEVDIVSDKGRDDFITEEDVKSEKRNMLAKYFNKMSPKQKIGSAIGAGIALSTAAAMVDPGAKEAAHPITKRGLNDEQQLLNKRGKYGKKDIAVVSVIAGVAGLTGLMKRDEFVTETVEEREPIYQDIVERANPKSFQNRAFAIADYATIALMAGTLIKNGAGAISNSKAHQKRGLNTFTANETNLFVKRAIESFSGKAELLKPIDVEYQSFLSKRSIGEDMVDEITSDDILEDISDDSSDDTISRRTVKMRLNGPFTHMLTSRASHTTSTAQAKAAHPSMDNLVGKMSMATIAGAITAPILKSVLGGGSSSPSKSPSHSPSPVKRNFTTPEISMEKRAEYSKYIEAVKQQVIEKPKKRDNSNSMDEIKLVKRKAAATADYGKYIEAVKHQVVEKPKKRDISISFDSMDGVKMVKRKAAATEYGKYIEAVKESAEKH